MLTWPDLVIGGIALLFALKGFKRGFVAELAGAVALVIALAAAFTYRGQFDAFTISATHLRPDSAHVVGLIGYAVVAYLAALLVAGALSRIASLPVIGIANALGGMIVGLAKGLVGAWIVLYVALFFPLGHDLRADLARSTAVRILSQPDGRVDEIVRGTLPWFVKPFSGPLFARHRL